MLLISGLGLILWKGRMKSSKVTLVAKGKTAENAVVEGYLATINTASNLFKEVDFEFLNDYETINKINLGDIKNLIIPIQLHSNESVSNYTYKDVLKLTKVPIHTHKLFTQTMNLDSKYGNVCFGEVLSTYQIALSWLIMSGFRDFKIYGVGKDSGYHKEFEKNDDVGNYRDSNWYAWNYNLGVNILKKYDCDWEIL